MFNKKNTSQDVFSTMEQLLSKTASVPTEKSHLAKTIDKLEAAMRLLDKHQLRAQADVLGLFLEKLAGSRDYTACMTKLAASSLESSQSNAILNKALDSLDADSVLDVEIDDDLSAALDRMKADEE